ncbi:MAG: hypothetical protein K8R92_02440 [Planctomycetes bacterium]|nr:hypothetical protein [Planctomycetota bacterium]
MVAARLKCDFVDLDEVVLKRLGTRTVFETFHSIGEPAWRAAECAELARLLSQDNTCVLSLGGGTPMAPGAAELLLQSKSQGTLKIALLEPGDSELARRLANNRGDRPLLPAIPSTGDANADAIAEVRTLNKIRMPLYRSLADVIVDTSSSEPACVEQIISSFRKAGS